MSRITKPRTRTLTILLAAIALVTLPFLSGCGSADETRTFCETGRGQSAESTASQHVVIVVGNVANAPSPQLPASVTEDLQARLLDNARVDIVSTAGSGYLCTSENLGIKPAGNPDEVNEAARKNRAAEAVKLIQRELETAPRSDGADLYSALQLAGNQLMGVGAEKRLLVVLSSGVNDRGSLDYTVAGAVGADVDDTLAALEGAGPLPSLAGTEVVAVGLGFTAAPQEEFRPIDRQQITDTYQAIFETSDAATVTIDPRPINGESVNALGKSVNPVEVEELTRQALPEEACSPHTEVFTQASAVRFQPRSATFVDEPAARAALEPVVTWLGEDRARTVTISGTTARWGSKEGQIEQGRQRAQAVAELLTGAGVDASQIAKVEGLGSYFPEYQSDLDASGRQIPAAASLNRSIRLTLQKSC